MKIRIGQGFDIHAFGPGNGLRLGGVTIADHRRLIGHSDADALLHAISDALLGAAGLGDIGRHFPDTDPRWHNADSGKLLQHCTHLVHGNGWRIENIDSTIITEQPKISPHAPAMVDAIAALLGITASQVSVKAKTSERLGFVGRQEGLAVMAIALLHSP